MRLLGIDPGLRNTGWGVVETAAGRLAYVASGSVRSDESRPLAERLTALFRGLGAVIAEHGPVEAAVEETFVNRNPASTLKLGQARGVALLAPAEAGLMVAEYGPTAIKKAVVGTGRAEKGQIGMMVRTLLPGARTADADSDAADALAVAICHAHHRATAARRPEAAS